MSALSAALATRAALNRKSARILPQYNSLHHRRWWKLACVAFTALALFLIMYTGFLVAIGGTLAFRFVAFPIGILAALGLWMLPDVEGVQPPGFFKLVSAYLLAFMCWPTYVAVVIPGLPWLTPSRLVLAALLIAMLSHFPQVAESRQRVLAVVRHDKLPMRLFLTYLAMEWLVLPLCKEPITSASYITLHLFFDLAPALVLAWVMYEIKNLPRLMLVVVLGSLFTLLVAVLENWMQHPPWMNIIPSFMQVDASLMEAYYSPQARIGDNRYRIRSIFPIVLYYAQFVVIVMPILLYQIWNMRGKKRLLGLAMLPLILHAVWYLNARTAMIGTFISVGGFAGMVLLRMLIANRRQDSLKTGILMACMLLGLAMMGGVLATSHRAQMYTFGGAQHAGSNDVRAEQWAITRSEVKRNPIGQGMGVRLDAFPVGSTGEVVVDSLWINLLVGVGPIGFVGFMGSMMALVWAGFVGFLRSNGELEDWSGALALSVLNFVVSSYVISSDDNIYLVMALGVCILALRRAQDERLKAAPVPALPAPTPSRALVRRPG